MSDMTADRGSVTGEEGVERAAALEQARVLVEEYAGYDEDAARRRIARRIAADRTRPASGAPGRGAFPAPASLAGRPRPPAPGTTPVDDLVLDAACHVRAARALDDLAWSLAESRPFAELALAAGTWPYGAEPALLFGCLLHLADRMEGAQFWFQYAAGAGSQTAARLLHLHHLARAEVRTARHWKALAGALPADEGLPLLPEVPENLEEALGASVIWTSPPISTQDLTALTAVRGRGGRPPYRLPARLRRAVTARSWSDDPDLGEVFLPGPHVAVAVAQHARLNLLHLTDEANAGALEAPGRPKPVQAGRGTSRARPAPVAMEAVHRALRVLEVVHRYSGGVSLAQVARETRLPQLVLARVTEQLVRANLVAPAGPGAYVAGRALLLTGAASGDGRGHLRETLAWVRDAVGAAVYVARYTDGEVCITQYADGPATPLVDEWVDFRAAAHASAVGKALLAQLGPDARRDHLSRHRPARFTAHTIIRQDDLVRQLDARRPGAPLLDLQEYAMGTVCAAVPITSGPNAECLALSIPAPDPHRLVQAARILRSEAAAVLLALIVAGSAPGTARPEPQRAEGAGAEGAGAPDGILITAT
ncbi:transcriptional regulator, IclR family [Actinobacteria bacterium OV450]|nr:transcriptional regulator, IclR family [Actinobacteria bacterium OV450]